MKDIKDFSNSLTPEEYIKFCVDDERILSAIAKFQEEIESLKKDVEYYRKGEENMREQIYFRDEFLEQIKDKINSNCSKVELKKWYPIAFENTYIEL